MATTAGALDTTKTAALRRRPRNVAVNPDGGFDFGPARSEWERVHGIAAERIAGWLPTLPVAVRRYAQAAVYRQLHETGPGPYRADAIAAVLAAVGAALGLQEAALQQAAQ